MSSEPVTEPTTEMEVAEETVTEETVTEEPTTEMEVAEETVTEEAVTETKDTMDEGEGSDDAAGEEEQEEEEEEAEQKAAASPRRRGGRSRKKVVQYNAVATETKRAVTDIPDGAGATFRDIPLISGRIDKMKTDDAVLKKLYRVCFGVQSRKKDIKKNMRLFNGFDTKTVEETVEKRKKWLSATKTYNMLVLKPLCNFLGLQVTGTREELIDRLLEFVQSPEDSGKEYTPFSRARKGTKRKKPSKKKSKKKSTGPRKLSGYIMFGKHIRPQVKSDDPDLSFTEVTQAIAKRWGALSDAKKEEWKEKGANVGPKVTKKKPKKKPAKKKAKKSKKKVESSAEEESESESEESSSDDDEPLGGDNVESKMDAAIKGIVMNGDLALLTKKVVRAALVPDFGQDVVTEHKAHIKACIAKYVQQRTA